MKLQLALDMPDINQARAIAAAVHEQVDIIEIGTLLLFTHGAEAIRIFREALPSTTLLADMKIVDRGKDAALIGLRAGADWVTVLAGTSKNVIHAVAVAAHEMNKHVMLDLIDSHSPGQSALEAESLGIDAILFHKSVDDEEHAATLLDQWEMVRGNTKLPIYVSAPITRTTATPIIDLKPQGIVLGTSITSSANPAEEITLFRELLSVK